MRAVVATVLLCAAIEASGCGYCVEDKIAATYDYAVVTRAMAQKHQVVFLHVEGPARSRQALEHAAYAAGADKASVRVSADLLTVAFAFDPARATLGAIHARMEKALKSVSLMPFELMERPGDLEAARAARQVGLAELVVRGAEGTPSASADKIVGFLTRRGWI